MCIENPKEPTAQDLKRKTAYKVFYKNPYNSNDIQYIFCINGDWLTPYKFEWNTALTNFYDCKTEQHLIGFHVFKHLKHAKMYQGYSENRTTYKVKIRNITKKGHSEILNEEHDEFVKAPILLVQEFKIIKEIPK